MERKAKLIALLAMIYVATVVISLTFISSSGAANLLAENDTSSTFDTDRIGRAQAITHYGSWVAVAIIFFAVWRLLLKHELYGRVINFSTLAAALILGIPLGLLLGFMIYPTGTLMWQPVISASLVVLAISGVVLVFSQYAANPETL